MSDVPALVSPYEPATFASRSRVARRAFALALTISGLLVEAQFGARRAPAYALRAQRTAQAILRGHDVQVVASGRRPDGPAVLVTNHVSYLDPLVVSSIVPCLSIAKGETRGWPLIGPGLEALGVLFVRRGDPHSGAVALRRAGRALQGGTAVLNFPEGTTTDGRTLGGFRRGVFGLARLARVPVVPARIDYDDDRVPWFGGEAFAPHYARLARTARVVARLAFGEPMVVRPSDDPTEVAARAKGIVDSLRRP